MKLDWQGRVTRLRLHQPDLCRIRRLQRIALRTPNAAAEGSVHSLVNYETPRFGIR